MDQSERIASLTPVWVFPLLGMAHLLLGIGHSLLGVAHPLLGVGLPLLGAAHPLLGVVLPLTGVDLPRLSVGLPLLGVTNSLPLIVVNFRGKSPFPSNLLHPSEVRSPSNESMNQ